MTNEEMRACKKWLADRRAMQATHTAHPVNNYPIALDWVEKLLDHCNRYYCLYCTYEVKGGDCDRAASEMAQHIVSCTKHPLGQALAEVEKLKVEVERLRGALRTVLTCEDPVSMHDMARDALGKGLEHG